MKKSKFVYLLILSTSVVLITLLFAVTSPAEEIRKTEGATFIGTYTDSLSISTDNDSFFRVSIMNPGDRWESHITIRNNGEKDIQVSFREILDKLNDPFLLDVLDLKIVLNDKEVVYDGKYAATSSPIIDWFTLKSGKEAVLTVLTGFPDNCGNDYQGKKFDTDWIFEVRAEEPAGSGNQDYTEKRNSTVPPVPEQNNNPPSTHTPDNSRQNDNSQTISNPENSSRKENSPKNGIVQTGDAFPILRYASMIILAGIALFLVIPRRRKKQNTATKGTEVEIDEIQL